MNKAANPNSYVVMGQSILQKLSLAPTAIPVANLVAIARKAKGSLRDFNTDVMVAGIAAGGVIPQ